jgi:hypothetical protein
VIQPNFWTDDQWVLSLPQGTRIDAELLFKDPLTYSASLGSSAKLVKASSLIQTLTADSLQHVQQFICIPRIVLPADTETEGYYHQTLHRPAGTIHYQRRFPADGSVTFTATTPWAVPKCKSIDQLYIDHGEHLTRTQLPLDPSLIAGRHVFIARVPDGFDSSMLQHAASVFTAGIRSWKKLATLGVTVHGCLESLGEDELYADHYQKLFPGSWIKLTHRDAITAASHTDDALFQAVIPHYALGTDTAIPSLTNKTHCYWKSALRFERAYKNDQSLAEKIHGVGLGNSLTRMKASYPQLTIIPCLHEEQFIQEVL